MVVPPGSVFFGVLACFAIAVDHACFICCVQIRGELPQSKCRLALDAVGLTDHAAKEDTSSVLADTIAHMGQEVICCLQHEGNSISTLIVERTLMFVIC